MDRILSAINFFDYIKKFTALKAVYDTNAYTGTCPICKSKGYTFVFDSENKTYQCLSCSSAGNIITFVADKNKVSEIKAAEILSTEFNIPFEVPVVVHEKALYDIYSDTTAYYNAVLNKYSKKGKEYVKKRELSDKTVEAFKLGFSPATKGKLYNFLHQKYSDELIIRSKLCSKDDSGEWYDRFTGRFMFPIFDTEGRAVGFGGRVLGDEKPKYLNSPESEIFEKRNLLYGFNIAKTSKNKYLILCEGYMDVIALHQAGFNTAVASLGTAFTKEQAELVKSFTDTVYLSYDNDSAGIKAAMRAIPMLSELNITTKVIDKADTKDPDEFIKKYGAEKFNQQLDNAMPADKWLLIAAKDVLSEEEYWKLACETFERRWRNG